MMEPKAESIKEKLKIWTVDAFTNQPFSGNPAGVILVTDFPPDALCQKIAAEVNLSETTFLKSTGPDRFHIRWFTPTVEVKLCGHATLASAHVLFENGLIQSDCLTLDSLSGPLFIKKIGDQLVLDFPLQKTGGSFSSPLFQNLFGTALIRTAVQAYDDIIVELKDDEAVRTLELDPIKVNEIDCRGLIVTARGKAPYDFVSRFFAPRVGVAEDPVTGSAHCKLADYWQKKLNKQEFLAYQASLRGGIIRLKVKGERVHLMGTAVIVIEGWISIY